MSNVLTKIAKRMCAACGIEARARQLALLAQDTQQAAARGEQQAVDRGSTGLMKEVACREIRFAACIEDSKVFQQATPSKHRTLSSLKTDGTESDVDVRITVDCVQFVMW